MQSSNNTKAFQSGCQFNTKSSTHLYASSDVPYCERIFEEAGTVASRIRSIAASLLREENKIVKIKNVGYPGVPIDSTKRPELKEGGYELDCEGMYLMPGFVDMHGHIGGRSQGADAEYVFKLWMGHRQQYNYIYLNDDILLYGPQN